MRKQFDDLDAIEREWLDRAADEIEAFRRLRSSCPPLRLIRAAQAEALPDELQAHVTMHVAGCQACQRLREDLESLPPPLEVTQEEIGRILRRVGSEPSAELPAGHSPGRRILWRALLVTAACASGFFAFRQLRHSDTPPPSAEVAVVAQEAPAPAWSPEAPKLEKPDVKLTLAILTWRSGGSQQGLLSDIAPALEHYRADRFADAAAEFEALIPKYPGSVEVQFYLGVSHIFLGEFPAAIQALEQAAKTGNTQFADDISWYLGSAYQRSGRLSEARVLFSSLCSGKGAYTARGCEAVEALNRAPNSP